MSTIADLYTFADLVVRAATRDPDGDALLFPDSRVSFSDLLSRATDSARSLGGLGVRRGDHVGILMANCQDFVDLLIGTQLLGAWVVPINSRYKSEELRHVISDADLSILVTSDRIVEHVDFVELLNDAFPDLAGQQDPHALRLASAPNLRSMVLFGGRVPPGMLGEGEFRSLVDRVHESEIDLSRSRVAVRDVAMMMYTSGTTAMPKGCPISHEALVRPGVEAGRTRFLLDSDDRLWDPLPMYHMSFVLPLVACLDAGAALLTMEYFEPGEALSYMEREKATVNYGSFPTITEALLNHPDYDADRLDIRVVNNVGPPDVLKSMQDRMPGTTQISAYGMTECGGVISFGDVDDTLEDRTRTSGRPFRGVEVQIRDLDTDEVLGHGQAGEILVRGYCLFEGYYNDDDKNAESFTEDGWFRTGDICSVDVEGRITYEGRAKDMLKVGGENVAAAEIEGLLSQHEAVMLAQVVSAPDAKYLEVPAAFVQLVEGREVGAEELIEFCRGKFASFKVPRHIRFVTEWPMSATKIQKHRLREAIARDLASGS